MKVLVVGHTYIAPINREKWKIFAQTYPDVQIKVLIPKKWRATLFDIEAGDLSAYQSNNLEFIALDIFKSGNEILYCYKFHDLIKIIKSFKPDIVHVEQGDNAFSYWQLIFLSKIFCRKAKFTFFTWINWTSKRSWKYKLFWRWIEKFNLFFSSGAFVGNEQAKIILQNKSFRKPTKVLFQLGVNERFFKPAEKTKENKLIGYIGRLTEEKGVFLLVDAFAELAKEFADWKLCFVGNGSGEKKLVDYVNKLGLQNRVEFRPAVPHEKIGLILNELEFLVLPSYDTPIWKEQFGHILIEAMACKIPVTGSSAGQIPYVIGDAGLTFEQKNLQGLKNCLKRLMLDSILRKKLGEKGYHRFHENFSYQVVVDQTYSFWKSL